MIESKQNKNTPDFDIIVVGSGPGGYVAAIRAAQLGFKTLVIEKAELGGICANWGCIPTKALLHSAEVFSSIQKEGEHLGIVATSVKPNFPQVIKRSRGVAANQSKGVAALFKKNQIQLLAETATLFRAKDGSIQIQTKTKTLSAKYILLATGARPRILPGIEPDGKQILTYFEAMNLPSQPHSLAIIGAGAIGVEFAYFYNALGTKVTLLEAMPRILPVEDDEISLTLEKSLQKQGIQIITNVKVNKVMKQKDVVELSYTNEQGQTQKLEAEKLLSAIGVQGNIENLGLEECGIKTEKSFIKVNSWYQTIDQTGKPIPQVYAIGDVIGPPLLAHKASAEGIACIEKLAGIPDQEIHKVDYSTIPAGTFCRPEVGSMGLTEKQAIEKGYTVKIGRYPLRFSGKGQATGETEGFAKIVLDEKTGEILGAHLLGGTASDMIATLTLARSAELTSTEVLHTIFAHPTFAELMKGSIEEAYGQAIDL